MKHIGFVTSTIAITLLAVGACLAPAQETVLYSFIQNQIDGTAPVGALVADSAGNLYGVTSTGGTGDGGTMFELSPPSKVGGKWTEQVIFDLGTLSPGPTGGPIFDSKGNLYGITGTVVYELSPPAKPSGSWTGQAIYTFVGDTDGASPTSSLVFDSQGNLYGIVATVGLSGNGGVFELSPPASPGGNWTEQILHTFSNSLTSKPVDGYHPGGNASVIVDAKGNVYGTTESGGANGTGIVYELSPPATPSGAWTETILLNLSSSSSGSLPIANLVFDAKGNLYGTASTGGASIMGTVFELSPPASQGGQWTVQVLHSFDNDGTDGVNPSAGLIFDSKGNLYGNTFHGGPNFPTGQSFDTDGILFELIPQSSGGWAEQILYDFGDTTGDAVLPESTLLRDSKGNLYGTANGGANACNQLLCGAVYEYTPVPTTDLPVFSLASGTYPTTQTVTITDGTPDAVIYFTTDGSTPTTSSTKYTSEITVSKTETIHAIAVAADLANSAVAWASYTIGAVTTATPVLNPAPPTIPFPVQGPVTVTITDATPNAVIYYTTNGQPPTTSSAVYSAPIVITATESIGAIAKAPNYLVSAEAGGTYLIAQPKTATPVLSPAPGTYAAGQKVTITDATPSATIYYTTNGSTPGISSSKYSGPIALTGTETIEAFATASGHPISAFVTGLYTIAPATPPPTFSVKTGTYPAAQRVTISDTAKGAAIFYTTNGTTPTKLSTKYLTTITVSATETLEAIAVATGDAPSAAVTAKYTIEKPAAKPIFLPIAGKYPKGQLIKITDVTPKAVIHYTTNGTTPTAASPKYTAEIALTVNETIKAIAIATGYTNSPVASAIYTLDKPAATPIIKPVTGTYSKAQTVTITDATPKATIYYTINGAIPTAASTKYTKGFAVTKKTIIKAIAVATGFSASAAASATITIN